MNIREAKEEICNTLRAYHQKDEQNRYKYPLIRQRPILLIGPPGIGKTAIMEQAARECDVGLVAYTITHHTRQSAIGLPHIETKVYGGIPMEVTEYTMSEIIASVYECMERTGKQEGILFIDEINCVSETLAPVMLQFLQNKTFGSHRVPPGWMLVAAGNPPEYNKSVREFDIVTLDRVRKIEVEADCGVWMEYAWRQQVHGAVLSYLSIKKENFYLVENTVDGKFFVTARGWEDLSEILKSYEELGIPITKALVVQYLQKEEIAGDFAAYYQLYRKYGTDYGIGEILDGTLEKEAYQEKISMAQKGAFEERFTVVNLVLACLDGSFLQYEWEDETVSLLHEALVHLKKFWGEKGEPEAIGEFIRSRENSLDINKTAELISEEHLRKEEWVLEQLREYRLVLKKEHIHGIEEGFSRIRELFENRVEARKRTAKRITEQLERAFSFVEDCFGDEQEMVLLVSGLTRNKRAAAFLSVHKSEAYLRYSEKLLYRKREKELQKACRELMKQH